MRRRRARRRGPRFFRVVPLAAIGLLAMSAIFALTASNTVPTTHASKTTATIGADDLKPSDCAAITLTAIVTGATTITGSTASELILGSSGVDTISGLTGNDCIVGGGGNDIIDGGLGGTDVCIGGPGTDTFSNCETQVQ